MTGLSRWRLDGKPEYEGPFGPNSCNLMPVLLSRMLPFKAAGSKPRPAKTDL